ncbi:MAG: hypothetical protein JW384_01609 [Nitrosomonadaceae bacterium]|nr:hypothetical protein [Nitrosomonadaceae bacterium]
MDINITYRPLTGTISAWNALDEIMSDLERKDIKRTYQDGNDEGWFVAMDTLKGHFHAIAVLDCHGAGGGWNLFLSEHLNDNTIRAIYNQITKWDKLTPQDADTRTKVSAHYNTTITVDRE